MTSKGDQAAKLRALAQKQGIEQKDEVLTYRSLMQGKRSASQIFMGIVKVVVVLALLGACAAGGYLLFENTKKDKAMIQELAKKSENLKGEIVTLNDKTKLIEDDVVRSVKENEKLTKVVQDLHSTNKELQGNYSKIVQDKQAMEKELQVAGNRISSFEKTKQDLQVQTHVQLSSLQAQIKELQTSLSQTQAVTHAQTAPEPAQPVSRKVGVPAAATIVDQAVDGKILLVNQKLQFVIVNMGTKQGVKAGSRFVVLRENIPIEILKAIEVRPEVSACESKSSVYGLQAGDKIKVQ